MIAQPLARPAVGAIYMDLHERVLTEVLDLWPDTGDAVVKDVGSERLRSLTLEYLADYCRLVPKR